MELIVTAGYVKNPPPVAQPGFNDPTEFGGAINAPSVNGKSTYIGMKFFSGSYNPQQCTTACQAQTVYDHRHPAADGSYQPCVSGRSWLRSLLPIVLTCSEFLQLVRLVAEQRPARHLLLHVQRSVAQVLLHQLRSVPWQRLLQRQPKLRIHIDRAGSRTHLKQKRCGVALWKDSKSTGVLEWKYSVELLTVRFMD